MSNFPIAIDYSAAIGARKIKWLVPMERLDSYKLLEVLFYGLRETEHPYSTIVCEGIWQMVEAGGDRVAPLVPKIIQPIREALQTRNKIVICNVLNLMQRMIVFGEHKVCEALMEHYRKILLIFNIFKNCKENVENTSIR
uniref:Uncharacterized protein n=1 Tax=Denticeps clupeoides TaxID=299321 RepID=A0AAY4C6E2_9TELE